MLKRFSTDLLVTVPPGETLKDNPMDTVLDDESLNLDKDRNRPRG